MDGGKDPCLCRIMDHVGLVRTVAVQDYVGGHFELEQSDMIFDAVLGTGPLDRQGEDYDRIVASSGEFLARLIE